MKLIKLSMPSQGDMEIVKQEGGAIVLKPTYFGGECAGPIIQFIDDNSDEPCPTDCDPSQDHYEKVEASFRIRIRKDNDLKLAKAD
jgi:hypothetical protein